MSNEDTAETVGNSADGVTFVKDTPVRWRTPDEAVREALEQEVAELRAVLREWLALDESFTNCDFAFLREMVAKHHRLAPVVLKTRQLLDGDA
jgi:hypothetical protein